MYVHIYVLLYYIASSRVEWNSVSYGPQTIEILKNLTPTMVCIGMSKGTTLPIISMLKKAKKLVGFIVLNFFKLSLYFCFYFLVFHFLFIIMLKSRIKNKKKFVLFCLLSYEILYILLLLICCVHIPIYVISVQKTFFFLVFQKEHHIWSR